MHMKRMNWLEYSLFTIPLITLSLGLLPRVNSEASANISQFAWIIAHWRVAREKARRTPTCSKLKQIGSKQRFSRASCPGASQDKENSQSVRIPSRVHGVFQ